MAKGIKGFVFAARTKVATLTLLEMGFTNVKSMAGGFSAWQQAGLSYKVSLRTNGQSGFNAAL